MTNLQDPSLDGALLCPACAIVHGRCADAIYPLLHVAHTTGDSRYLNAALLLYDWSERQVSRADGSWINDVALSSWQGITVFHTIALAESLHHHGDLLDPATRQRWTARVARAAKFLDGFISMQTGNINYPITSTYCFALCGQLLNEPRYAERAQKLAHAAMDYFTPNHLLFGEGHPLDALSAKGCRPVDLGYNVEESLPALTLYGLLTQDKPVLQLTVAALRAHLEFMLPNGAWDNSWGTRNYKWSWWGSRTSDGCHPAYALLAPVEPVFREAAYRNLELMAACTHNGLLYGGPDYALHGDLPCIHHTFTHAKALATVLDKSNASGVAPPSPRLVLPRDVATGLKSFPEIGTHLASIGDWRATVTEYDFDYFQQTDRSAGSTAGHVTGGSLSLLYHRTLGPLCTASMTQYQIVELSNQQVHRDAPTMPLTPRIEYSAAPNTKPYASTTDFSAVLTTTSSPERISFNALGRLLTAEHKAVPGAGLHYHLVYTFTPTVLEIVASTDAPSDLPQPASHSQAGVGLSFILPIIARQDETVDQPDPQTIRITKPTGTLLLRTDAAQGFAPLPKPRTFNLVPGFECVPIAIAMQPGQEVRIQLTATLSS
ncbi:MAG: hypothetical protein JWM43_4200 [Acidobacteriaceae bacterium]|nr:hypothetical protein [Acidobacteriaceae bacterium]